VFLSFLVGIFAATAYFVLMIDPTLPPLFYIFEIGYTTIMFYALVQYRLMDINLAFRYSTIYLFYLGIVGVPIFGITKLIGGSLLPVATAFLGVALGPLAYERARPLLTKMVDALPLFRGRYWGLEKIQASEQEIQAAQTVPDWAGRIIDVVKRIYNPKSASVLVRDDKDGYFLIRAGTGLGMAEMAMLHLPFKSPLNGFFQKEKRLFVRYLVNEIFPEEQAKEVAKDINFVRGTVIMPLFHRNRLHALLCLDDKTDGNIYNEVDLSHLNTLARAGEHTLTAILSGLHAEQMTAVWAHDLLKPFTAKGSFRYLVELKDGNFGPISEGTALAVQAVLNDVRFVAKHLERLILPGSEEKYEIRPCPIAPVYLAIREKYSLNAVEKDLHWRVTPPPPGLMVDCDPEMIEHRVVANLVENAFRHTPRGGTVELGFHLEDKTLVGHVKDNGLGIKKSDQEKLFARGVQLDPTMKGLAGLGLFSVKTVVEAHRGRVWVESELGRGSQFNFTLPLA
jgi:signal transduction histidine kinase